jgi:hypothetical protein
MHQELMREAWNKNQTPGIFAAKAALFCIGVTALANLLHNRWGIPYTAYGAYGLILLAGVYVYRRRLLDFRYSLIEDELIFERVIGRRERLAAQVKVEDIVLFAPAKSAQGYPGILEKTLYLQPARHTKGSMVLIADRGESAAIRIYFMPSEVLKGLIESSIHL